MAQLSIPYELVGPDGTRVVTGNSDAARADLDWFGYLDPENGVVGLDGADVREAAGDIIGGDGGIQYDNFHGRRPVAINGAIWPEQSIEAVMVWEQRIKRATNAMRAAAPAMLRFQNSGFPMRRLAVYRQQPPRFPGRRPKLVQVQMVCPDYRLLADVETVSAATPLNGSVLVTNAGDETATPVLEITGPCAGTVIATLVDEALAIELDGVALGFGEVMTLDLTPPYPSIVHNAVPAYGLVDYLETSWWGLPPGEVEISVTAHLVATGTFRVRHRDAWI